jgi:hypothetical protein
MKEKIPDHYREHCHQSCHNQRHISKIDILLIEPNISDIEQHQRYTKHDHPPVSLECFGGFGIEDEIRSHSHRKSYPIGHDIDPIGTIARQHLL